jgi:hypothetical protein
MCKLFGFWLTDAEPVLDFGVTGNLRNAEFARPRANGHVGVSCSAQEMNML